MKKGIYKLLLLGLFLTWMSTTISAQEVGVYMWYGESKPSGNYVDNLRMVRAADGSWTTPRMIQTLVMLKSISFPFLKTKAPPRPYKRQTYNISHAFRLRHRKAGLPPLYGISFRRLS